MSVNPRPWLAGIPPYQPGKKAGSPAGSMASNESALGASPHVAQAVADAVAGVHRYPDPLADPLRDELAALHGVRTDQILLGNGSDELIYLLAMAYLAGGGRAVCADPGYRIDEISTRVVDAQLTQIPLRGWTHDLEAMARVPADIAYVVNPHNPTGTVRSRADIAAFAATGSAGLVVIDEAYIDFTDDPAAATAVGMVRDGGNVAVLRTFSKLHGLAGMRIGYLVAPAEVIATLAKIRCPFSVGTLAQAAALAALADTDHQHAVRRHNTTMRAEMMALFAGSGLAPVPSQANFILVPASDEAGLVEHLAGYGISVRPGSALGVPGTVRVSVPSTDGMRLLDDALRRPIAAAGA